MKTNTKICTALLSIGLCVSASQAFSQTTTTTVTTSRGAFTEYVPGSQTVVVRGETAAAAPLRYSVTKQTTIVDEAGAPIALERIPVGAPLSVQYTGTGDRLVASRIIVQRPAVTTTTAPVTTTTTVPATAPVTTHETTTTTTVTQPVSKKALKEEIERKKEALDEAADDIDD
ncbi:MAG TPA: hypothetical protein VJ719_00440 [Chthoniobacterales bacterium]|nr:hypothetical protein [Chthoniobacterales bacterium]